MTALAVDYLAADEARSLTDQIKAHVAELLPLIKEAFERHADVALGYANWLDYCDTELRGLRLPVDRRREAVAELREAGMSTRAIGAALGVDHKTVANDLRSTGESSPVAKVIGLDGKERPAAQPEQPKTAADVSPPSADGAGHADQAAPTAGAGVDAPPAPAGIPDRPKPPAWDPEERKAHEEEVRRVQTIEHARSEAKTIVTTVRAAVVTVVSGARLGERGLVTREMVAELRAAIDLLEKEIDGEE